jgi:hypothetical protein
MNTDQISTEELYAELLLERFGPVPRNERKRRLPLRRRWKTPVRVIDPPEVTAARRAVLAELPWRDDEQVAA